MFLPTGCNLIVRRVSACKPLSDTIKLLNEAVDSIRKDVPELSDVPVVVKQFSTHADWILAAYIHLDTCLLPKPGPGQENKPQTDLLQCWKDTIQSFNASWEVKWTPLTYGGGKCLWV